MGKISYGFGKEYLPKWGIKEALREVMQNYIDYKNYRVIVNDGINNNVNVIIENDYIPDELEFLRIGNSKKDNVEAIGQYGEGLKMAFLIFLRESLDFTIVTNKYMLDPYWEEDNIIGKTLAIRYVLHNCTEDKIIKCFTTEFTCPKDIWEDFYNNIIKEDDIVYEDDYHGAIVNKPQGNIYSGGLFVCKYPNLARAYDIKPSQLRLNRDRNLPEHWDISYHTSKLNEKYDNYKHTDLSYADHSYINDISYDRAKEYKPIVIASKIEFIHTKSKDLVKNDEFKSALKSKLIDEVEKVKTVSRKDIVKSKQDKAKRKSSLSLLKAFIKTYNKVLSIEAKEDLKIILNKLKNGK